MTRRHPWFDVLEKTPEPTGCADTDRGIAEFRARLVEFVADLQDAPTET